MHGIGEVARRLQESDGMKAASRNVVELLAVDMAEAPKVARRLEKVLGDKAAEAGPALAEALMPVITKWLEAQGIKVQGSAAAEKAPPFYAKGNLPCFSHPAQDEIEVGGKKIVGSAQKRAGQGFLQQVHLCGFRFNT